MAYTLPELPYSFDSLEPFIDALTLKIHYTKHHQGYIDKLNEALKDYPKYSKYAPEVLVTNWKKLPKSIQDAVRNQGGGVVNHTLFWEIMKKDDSDPTGEIATQINKDFGSFVDVQHPSLLKQDTHIQWQRLGHTFERQELKDCVRL